MSSVQEHILLQILHIRQTLLKVIQASWVESTHRLGQVSKGFWIVQIRHLVTLILGQHPRKDWVPRQVVETSSCRGIEGQQVIIVGNLALQPFFHHLRQEFSIRHTSGRRWQQLQNLLAIVSSFKGDQGGACNIVLVSSSTAAGTTTATSRFPVNFQSRIS